MTQQFKFGDRLCNLIGREFIYLMAEGDTCIVVDILGVIHLLRRGTLVLIPHPDTVRLDWLVKNDCALTERLCDEDGDLLDTPFAVIQKQEEHFEVLTAACDIREAIDAAMRQEAV